MNRCDGRIEAISTLLDGELSESEELELRRHLEDCEVCGAWKIQLETLTRGVAASLGRERIPAGVAMRIDRLRPSHFGSLAPAMWVAAALALALAIGLGRPFAEGVGAEGWTDRELIDDHRRWISAEAALAVVSSDPEEIGRNLSARLPFPISVSRIEGATLRGGQDCSLRGGRAAYLQYERDGERISVFTAPHLDADLGQPECRFVGDAALCTYPAAGHSIAIVASRKETARTFRRAAMVLDRP